MSDADIGNLSPVARIMKTALPENAKIAKEAKECMQECVSEFISFITSEGMCSFFPSTDILAISNGDGFVAISGSRLTNRLFPHVANHSVGKMPARKTKDGEWRGYPIRHDIAGFRELRRGSQNIPCKVPRSKLT
jgi:hypothetical protein